MTAKPERIMFSLAATLLFAAAPAPPARAQAVPAGAPIQRALDTSLPSLSGAAAGLRTLRSFFGKKVNALVVVIETTACDLCDRAAGVNAALGKSLIRPGTEMVYLVAGPPPGDPAALVRKRNYQYPVLFDLDGSVSRMLDPKVSEPPYYVVVTGKGERLAGISASAGGPAIATTSIVTTVLMYQTREKFK